MSAPTKEQLEAECQRVTKELVHIGHVVTEMGQAILDGRVCGGEMPLTYSDPISGREIDLVLVVVAKSQPRARGNAPTTMTPQ